jgi:hypothetical protein
MWALEGILSGLIAGAIMIIVSEIGYRLDSIKGNLIIIDGSFAARLIKVNRSTAIKYVLGIAVHLVTSAVFGLIYTLILFFTPFDNRTAWILIPYVILLWLAMLFVALPIAGAGIMGRRFGKYVWAEQLVLHVVFGFVFWWALGLF